MSLSRVWIPSPNCSGRGGVSTRLIVLHTTEGFTGPNGLYDLGNYFKGNVGASSHVGIDNFHPGTIGEYVSRTNKSWTQCNANPYCISAEQCGFAAWPRDTWLNNQGALLANTAAWIAEEAAALNIPIRALTASQAQSGSAGVCQHRDLGSPGCGHSDCGDGYPMDVVLDWAAAGGGPAEEDDMTPGITYWYDPVADTSQLYMAMVGTDNRIYYKGPDTDGNWHGVDPNSYSKYGVEITSAKDGSLAIGYINKNGVYCTYERKSGGGTWGWSSRGGTSA